MPHSVAFHAKARRDLNREWHYLYGKAGVVVADAFLESVESTAEMLLRTPLVGMLCQFDAPRISDVRRFFIDMPFGKWIVFYAPTDRGITVHRIVHGARDLKNYFS